MTVFETTFKFRLTVGYYYILICHRTVTVHVKACIEHTQRKGRLLNSPLPTTNPLQKECKINEKSIILYIKPLRIGKM